jgi:hypothetical protein
VIIAADYPFLDILWSMVFNHDGMAERSAALKAKVLAAA